MPKNNVNKETKIVSKKELKMKAKFRNKQELAKAKTEMLANISNIRKQIKEAKASEIKLMAEIQKEEIKAKEEAHKKIVEERSKVAEKKKIIEDNKKFLKNQKRELKAMAQLKKQENKKIILEAKRKNKQAIALEKERLESEKLQHKLNLEKIKEKNAERLNEKNKEVIKRGDAVSKYIIESEVIINNKRKELKDNKSKLANELEKMRQEMKLRKNKKILDMKNEKLSLKELEAKEKVEYQDMLLKLKNKSSKSEKELAAVSIKLETAKEDSKDDIANAKIESNEKIENINKESKANIQKASTDNKYAEYENEVEKEIDKGIQADLTGASTSDEDIEKEKEEFRGVSIQTVGKRGYALFEKYNMQDTKYKLEKMKIKEWDRATIKEFQKLKEENKLATLEEFSNYASFISGEGKTKEDIEKTVVSIVVNILRGKSFQFLGGYMTLSKEGRYKFIRFSKKVNGLESKVVSLPKSKFTKELNKVVLEKLKKGVVVKLTENIGIKWDGGEVKVVHDLGFFK